MSKRYTSQSGFGFLALLLVAVVVAAIVLVGLKVAGTYNQTLASDSAKGQTAVPSKVANTADLQTASKALDTTNVDAVDLTQLDTALNSLL